MLAVAASGGIWLLYKSRSGIRLGTALFIRYTGGYLEVNLTHYAPDDSYIAVGRTEEQMRVGVFPSATVRDLIDSLNANITNLRGASEEEFERDSGLGHNLFISDGDTYEFLLLPNVSLIRVASGESAYYASDPLNPIPTFWEIFRYSLNHTDGAMEISALRFKEMREWLEKYSLKGVDINPSSERPIILIFKWTGCGCRIVEDKRIEVSIGEILEAGSG